MRLRPVFMLALAVGCFGLTALVTVVPVRAQAMRPDDPVPFLQSLVGTWDLRLPVGAGHQNQALATRTFRPGLNPYVVEWEEHSPSAATVGRGFFGFDAANQKYYILGVYTPPDALHRTGGPLVLTGERVQPGTVSWIPVENHRANSEWVPSVLQVVNADTLRWRAQDGQWVVTLVRQ